MSEVAAEESEIIRGELMPRDNIVLQCTECKSRNYVTTKNKKTTPERLEFRKFCRRCRIHRAHKETK
jgi:large subunit ribosomal protein L33